VRCLITQQAVLPGQQLRGLQQLTLNTSAAHCISPKMQQMWSTGSTMLQAMSSTGLDPYSFDKARASLPMFPSLTQSRFMLVSNPRCFDATPLEDPDLLNDHLAVHTRRQHLPGGLQGPPGCAHMSDSADLPGLTCAHGHGSFFWPNLPKCNPLPSVTAVGGWYF
jgi:hypothetical protein